MHFTITYDLVVDMEDAVTGSTMIIYNATSLRSALDRFEAANPGHIVTAINPYIIGSL